jgi:hypothetical protein
MRLVTFSDARPARVGAVVDDEVVRVEIDALGALENPVVDEPPPEVA